MAYFRMDRRKQILPPFTNKVYARIKKLQTFIDISDLWKKVIY